MNTEEIRERREKRVSLQKKYRNIVMGACYIIVGAGLAFFMPELNISDMVRWLLAGLLFLYGCFRLYRALS